MKLHIGIMISYSYIKKSSNLVETKGESHAHESEIHDNCPLCNINSNRVSFIQNSCVLFFQTIVFEFQNENSLTEISYSSISLPPRSPPENII